MKIAEKSGDFKALEFAEAALFLSGVEASERGEYLTEIERLFERFEASYGPPMEERLYSLGEGILLFLHEEVFTAYRETQTRLDIVLDRGIHNCVSSAVLYSVFALRYSLPVLVINTRDHAFCAVATERGMIDVETTTPYGFNPGLKKEFSDSFGRTGFTYVPPGNYSGRTEAGLIDLLGFILQNRIAALQRRNEYTESVPLAVDRYALLGTEQAFQEMVNEFVNFAALRNQRGEYTEALEFLDYVGAGYGSIGRLQELHGTLLHNLVLRFSEEGRYAEAEERISSGMSKGILDEEEYTELSMIVNEKRTYETVVEEPFREALSYVRNVYGEGKIPEERYREFVSYLHGRESERIAREGRWLEAAELLETGSDLLGGEPKLDRAAETYRYNYSVTVHNDFADLFNRERYDEAKRLLEEAIAAVPESRLLRKDLLRLEEVPD